MASRGYHEPTCERCSGELGAGLYSSEPTILTGCGLLAVLCLKCRNEWREIVLTGQMKEWAEYCRADAVLTACLQSGHTIGVEAATDRLLRAQAQLWKVARAWLNTGWPTQGLEAQNKEAKDGAQ